MAKVTVTFDHKVPAEIVDNEVGWVSLERLCVDYIKDLANGKHPGDDYTHWFFEAALEAMYGHDVWKFVNERLKYCE